MESRANEPRRSDSDGFMVPEMHMDVLSSGTPPGAERIVTRTILQNIEVLSAGQADFKKDAQESGSRRKWSTCWSLRAKPNDLSAQASRTTSRWCCAIRSIASARVGRPDN